MKGCFFKAEYLCFYSENGEPFGRFKMGHDDLYFRKLILVTVQKIG